MRWPWMELSIRKQIISAGSHDLAGKAKRWDEKHMTQLKLAKEKLNEEFKEITKKTRKQGELTNIESQIKGIENRLKYSRNDLTASDKTIRDYDRRLNDLQKELDLTGPNISDIERRYKTTLGGNRKGQVENEVLKVEKQSKKK